MRLGSKKLASFLGERKDLQPLFRLFEIKVKQICGDSGEIRADRGSIVFCDEVDYLWVSIPLRASTGEPLPYLLVTFLMPYRMESSYITGAHNLDRGLWALDVLVGTPDDLNERLLELIENGYRFVMRRNGISRPVTSPKKVDLFDEDEPDVGF